MTQNVVHNGKLMCIQNYFQFMTPEPFLINQKPTKFQLQCIIIMKIFSFAVTELYALMIILDQKLEILDKKLSPGPLH